MREVLRRYKPDVVLLYETHTSFANTKKFWDKVGYLMIVVEEARGHAGGIWVLKNVSTGFGFHVRETMHQCITFSIS